MDTRLSPVKLGDRDRSFATEGLVLTETFRGPATTIPSHYHSSANMGFVLSGSFVETVGRQPFDLRPGSIVLRPAGESHKNEYGKAISRSLVIEVGNKFLELMRCSSSLLQQAEHFRDLGMFGLALRIQKEMQRPDSATPLMIEGLTLEILGLSARRSARPSTRQKPVWLKRSMDFIHEQFSRPIGLAEIAAHADVNPAHFAKVFRHCFGCTVGEYVRRLRYDLAELELTTTEMPLSEIALRSGFYDQSHFTNAFKRRCGLTPSEYRHLHRRT